MAPDSSADPVRWAALRLSECGVEAPRLEAQLVLALALGSTRSAVVAGLFPALDGPLKLRFEGLVEARCRRIPFAYLRGSQEFYGLEFEVGPAVLIPRPETELLVDLAREWAAAMAGQPAASSPPYLIADVGTGSGCIAIAAAVNCPGFRAAAFDISPSALCVARRNAERHGLSDRIRFVRGSLLRGSAPGRFGLILSNPPYIATGQLAALQPEVREAEPSVALDGGLDGLTAYRQLAPQARTRLAPGGRLGVEVGMGQAGDVARIMADAGFERLEVRQDIAGIERMVTGINPAAV